MEPQLLIAEGQEEGTRQEEAVADKAWASYYDVGISRAQIKTEAQEASELYEARLRV